MIEKSTPLSMVESLDYLEKDHKEIISFIEKFVKLKNNSAKKLRDELEKLNIIKLNARHISKIIDILPGSVEEIQKIFWEIGLNEDESKKIVEIINKHK